MQTTTMLRTGDDVISFLKGQHQQIKGLFGAVVASRGEAREKAFFSLRRLLAVHETAEEEVVHVAARRVLPDGEAIIDKRLREEKKAKTALTELERLDLEGLEFESRFRALQDDVFAHAESEEKEEFDRLAGRLDAKHLARMKKAAELAEAIAPTRPHPGVESAAANLLVGPFASMMDRARDAMMKH